MVLLLCRFLEFYHSAVVPDVWPLIELHISSITIITSSFLRLVSYIFERIATTAVAAVVPHYWHTKVFPSDIQYHACFTLEPRVAMKIFFFGRYFIVHKRMMGNPSLRSYVMHLQVLIFRAAGSWDQKRTGFAVPCIYDIICFRYCTTESIFVARYSSTENQS